jgi:hypothetical protein
MDKQRYYKLKDWRRGIPFHSAQRFLEPFIGTGTQLHYFNRRGIIYLIHKNTFLSKDKDGKFRRAFQISFDLLEALGEDEAKLLESHLEIIFQEHIHTQVNLNILRDSVGDIKTLQISHREKFMRLMQYYAGLFEGAYRCLSSGFALAKIIHNGNAIPEDLSAFIQTKVTKHIEVLMDDEGAVIPALPELCKGCNRHLRNGISHNRWKMLGRKLIEIWDMNGKGKITWKQKYNEEALEREVETLNRTVDAMDLAVLVYVNNMCNRVKGTVAIPPGLYDDVVIKDLIEDVSMEFGLFADSCEYNEMTNSLTIHVYVPNNLDIAQESEIVEGSTPPRFYKVSVVVYEDKVIYSMLNMLLVAARAMHSYSRVTFRVSDEVKGDLGTFTFTPEQLKKFSEGYHDVIENELSPLALHTVRITRTGLSQQVA